MIAAFRKWSLLAIGFISLSSAPIAAAKLDTSEDWSRKQCTFMIWAIGQTAEFSLRNLRQKMPELVLNDQKRVSWRWALVSIEADEDYSKWNNLALQSLGLNDPVQKFTRPTYLLNLWTTDLARLENEYRNSQGTDFDIRMQIGETIDSISWLYEVRKDAFKGLDLEALHQVARQFIYSDYDSSLVFHGLSLLEGFDIDDAEKEITQRPLRLKKIKSLIFNIFQEVENQNNPSSKQMSPQQEKALAKLNLHQEVLSHPLHLASVDAHIEGPEAILEVFFSMDAIEKYSLLRSNESKEIKFMKAVFLEKLRQDAISTNPHIAAHARDHYAAALQFLNREIVPWNMLKSDLIVAIEAGDSKKVILLLKKLMLSFDPENPDAQSKILIHAVQTLASLTEKLPPDQLAAIHFALNQYFSRQEPFLTLYQRSLDNLTLIQTAVGRIDSESGFQLLKEARIKARSAHSKLRRAEEALQPLTDRIGRR